MKKIKRSIAIMLFCALVIPTIQSCKKYPDGPEFTLRSRTERVSHAWDVENYTINGVDYTSTVSNYTETYTKQGAYSYSWSLANGSGTWTFQSSDAQIQLNGSDAQSSRTLFILRLEDKSFWYYYMDGNDRHELHLIPN